MKYILTLFLFTFASLSFSQSSQKAILIANYGSTDAETRLKVLEVIKNDVKKEFKDYEICEAYISSIVRKRLKNEGIIKDSPVDALLKIKASGIDTVYVLTTTLLEGGEMNSLREDIEKVRPFFKKIDVSNPLLFSVEDCHQTIDLLVEDNFTNKGNTIFIGHGNQLPSTATYAMLDYMMKIKGRDNCFVSTIEGFPSFDSTFEQLKTQKSKSVTLVPLLLVCGNHTKVDIAQVWKNRLMENGYKVNVVLKGLGENEKIRNLFIIHLKDIIDKK